MSHVVSAVIATVGRPSVAVAVRSVLAQSAAVREVIVVLDAAASVPLPSDDRVVLIHAPAGSGAARCRQLGIDAARGSVIALLDDDDEWLPDKLECQLSGVRPEWGPGWVSSSRMAVVGPGDRRRTWPRRLIEPGESIADYLFRVREVGVGGAVLQTSTLVFPAALARQVPWDGDRGAVHDEPTWLIEVQRRVPDVRLLHVPEVLSVYDVRQSSVSRSSQDRTGDYIAWGLQHLGCESPRVRGDYMCSSPVSAAVSARSLSGVAHAVWSALAHGRPGARALTYAVLSAVRIVIGRLVSLIRS